MKPFVPWVDTILLNWIQWILLFPILSDSIFVIFITHRLLTLLTPCLTRQLKHSQLEPILWFIWRMWWMHWSLSLAIELLIFLILPTLLAGIIPLPDHTQPKYIWLTLPVWGIGSTQPWKVFLTGQHWNNIIYDSEQTIHLIHLSGWVGTPPLYFDQSQYWILFLYNSMAFKPCWVALGHTLAICLTALLCQLVLAYIW